MPYFIEKLSDAELVNVTVLLLSLSIFVLASLVSFGAVFLRQFFLWRNRAAKKREEAEAEAQQIINIARKKAVEANLFAEEVKRSFTAELEKLASAHAKRLEEIGAELGKTLLETSKDLRDKHFMELKSLYEKSFSEVAQYKKAALERVRNEIYGFAADIIKEISGKVLDVERHQQIVMEVLEKARQDKFFET